LTAALEERLACWLRIEMLLLCCEGYSPLRVLSRFWVWPVVPKNRPDMFFFMPGWALVVIYIFCDT